MSSSARRKVQDRVDQKHDRLKKRKENLDSTLRFVKWGLIVNFTLVLTTLALCVIIMMS